MQFTAVIKKVPRGYVGFVEEVPGAKATGKTLDDVRASLAVKVERVLEANRAHAEKSIKGKEVIREKLPVSTGMTSAEILRHLQRFS